MPPQVRTFIGYTSRWDQLRYFQDVSLLRLYVEHCEMVFYVCAFALSLRECVDISYAVGRTSIVGKVSRRSIVNQCLTEATACFALRWPLPSSAFGLALGLGTTSWAWLVTFPWLCSPLAWVLLQLSSTPWKKWKQPFILIKFHKIVTEVPPKDK